MQRREHIDSKGQIKPALLGLDVGDVALPELARALGRGSLCQPVFGDLMIMALSVVRGHKRRFCRVRSPLSRTTLATPGSCLSAPDLAGYVGINDRIAGRTAAWAIARCASRAGPVRILIGSHGYLGQENREIGFRTYFREKAPTFRILEPAVCSDDPEIIAYKETIEMLHGSEKLASGSLQHRRRHQGDYSCR